MKSTAHARMRGGLAGLALSLVSAGPAAQDAPSEETLKQGWMVFNRTCTVCHWPGVGGAPRIGDKAAWEARINRGKEVMYSNAINGWTGSSGKRMPARGGNWNLTDEQVRAAVDYIVHNSQ